MLPLVLLIILGLAGLRGAVATPRWNGPLHRDALAVGVALEVVFVTLFVITLGRTESGRLEPAAHKLRGMIIFALCAGMVAVAMATPATPPVSAPARRIWRMEQEAIRFSLRELGIPVVHWNGMQSLDLPLAGYTRRPLVTRR